VVDDARVDQRVTGAIVQQRLGWRVAYADNGLEALAAIDRERPALVLTDLNMPEMNGLELVEAIRDRHPGLPVVLMTAYGNEELAVQALHGGAASYVTKQRLEHDLPDTLKRVLAVAQANQQHHQLLASLDEVEFDFHLDNDPALIPALLAHLQPYFAGLDLFDQTGRVQAGMAVEEALLNALYHGNLQVPVSLRESDSKTYYRLAEDRTRLPPYRDRRLHVNVKLSRPSARFVIADEGPGFDRTQLPDPKDPTNMEKGGRGLFLIEAFMDLVSYSRSGNQLTLVKRRETSRSREA
jgi:CheY-like chemotaxis protein